MKYYRLEWNCFDASYVVNFYSKCRVVITDHPDKTGWLLQFDDSVFPWQIIGEPKMSYSLLRIYGVNLPSLFVDEFGDIRDSSCNLIMQGPNDPLRPRMLSHQREMLRALKERKFIFTGT